MEQEIEQRFERIETLLRATAKTVKAQSDLSMANTLAIRQLVEVQAETTNKLDALICVVDKWIREGKK